MILSKNAALLVVDCQNDFCVGGSLAVPGSELIFPIINRLQPLFQHIIATKDWHPANHTSFASNHPDKSVGEQIELYEQLQTLWPIHCVQNSRGAEFFPALNTSAISHIVYKGTDCNIDSYSAFFDNAHLRATGLADYLKVHAITTIYIVGLATDYCVLFSALDAIHLGLKTHVITDACRGVELRAGDVDAALKQMRERGVRLLTSSDLLTKHNR